MSHARVFSDVAVPEDQAEEVCEARAQALVAELESYGENERLYTLVYARILAEVAEASYKHPEAALAMYRSISSQPTPRGFLFLREAVFYQVVGHLRDSGPTELDVHALFWKHLRDVLPGARQLFGVTRLSAHVPDGWIELDGEWLPVEMKLNEWTASASGQLLRYMEAYKKPRGVAVASDFKAPDPRFICIKHSAVSQHHNRWPRN